MGAQWLEEKAAKPALFDGFEVVLLSELQFSQGRLSGLLPYGCRYSQFPLLAQSPPGRISAEHAYAHPILVSGRQCAGKAIRMAAGPPPPRIPLMPARVYFASGSFEPVDFPGGRVDVDLNMRREALGGRSGSTLTIAWPSPAVWPFAQKRGRSSSAAFSQASRQTGWWKPSTTIPKMAATTRSRAH